MRALPRMVLLRSNAVIYQVLSWYFIGFVLCVCGIPGSILGIKRFPNQLWVRAVFLRTCCPATCLQ